ncbi:MAG: A/G-specific adenine glycosylase [Alphaproteobacteria bacterium]
MAHELAASLLAWYDRERRTLPWRAAPGKRAEPYRVWLSEIMLQQTTVQTAGPYFERFLKRWPTVEALAAAELDEVLHAWQGLGYYARARNLHRAAKLVESRHRGRFPEREEELRALPGIGAYTAAAVAAIAFGRKATVVDGNVERVIARFFAVEASLPAAKPRLKALAATLTPEARAGDYAQAMMDLGALVCTPRRPRCAACPWQGSCAAYRRGIAEALPQRTAKAKRPVKCCVVFWLVRGGREVLLRRRPEHGLLGGLMELPSTAWQEAAASLAAARRQAPARTRWRALPGSIRHVFSHFELELTVLAGSVGETTEGPSGVNEGETPRWCRLDRLSDFALSSVMRKVVAHALANGG